MRLLSLAVVLSLARSAAAQVPLQSDTPPVDPPVDAQDAPAPGVLPSTTPSGTTLPSEPAKKPNLAPRPRADALSSALAAPAPLERRRPDIGILSGGLSMLLAGYVADIGFTYGYDHHPPSTSLIPLAGPWIQLGQRYGLDGPPIDTGSSEADARAKQTVDNANHTIRGLAIAGEVVSGIVQATGLVLVITGAISKGKPRRYRDATTRAPVSLLPHMQANGSLSLRF